MHSGRLNLVLVSNSLTSLGWAPRMNKKSVPFVTFPYGHKSVPLSCRHISFS